MKTRVITAALMVLGVVSCSRTGESAGTGFPEEGVSLVVRAVIGDGCPTKTAVQPDETSIWWTEGDAINLFQGSRSSGQFITDISSASETAPFYGTLSVATGTTADNLAAQYFWGVYPYSASNTCDGNSVTLTIPSEQGGVAGTFADKLNPAVAMQPSLNLPFYNVGSWFIFSVSQSNIASVSFSGLAGETLVGTVTVAMDSNAHPVVTDVQDGSTVITMRPEGRETFLAGEKYYMVLIPQTLSEGYRLTITRTNGTSAECVVSGPKTFERSGFRRKLDADSGLEFPVPAPVDLGLPSGLKWAISNLCEDGLAGSPSQFGDYYAWGEVEPYYTAGYASESPCTHWRDGRSGGYDWVSYKWCNGTNAILTKYNALNKYRPESTNGTVDNKMILEPEDDAAHVVLGGSWRMPTGEEWQELLDKCSWEVTTLEGVNGHLGTGPNGNTIFLPFAGFHADANFGGIICGYYWTSSLFDTGRTSSYYMLIQSDLSWSFIRNETRDWGFTIRPVSDEGVRVSVTGISLDKDNLSLASGESAKITATVTPSDATQPFVIWSSSDPSVATVFVDGTVNAVDDGTTTITATTYDGGYTRTCSVTVADPNAVDLGLPSGLKWANRNICETGFVNAPEDFGDYYAWGETVPFYKEGHAQDSSCSDWRDGKNAGYDWPSYRWCNGTYSSLTKYNVSLSYGTVDNLTVLEAEDDVASVKTEGMWRIPTVEDWQELIQNCSWTWTTLNGVGGQQATGPNGNSIFLPATGSRLATGLYNPGNEGHYWSSTLYDGNSTKAQYVNFGSSYLYPDYYARCYGHSVRPVSE